MKSKVTPSRPQGPTQPSSTAQEHIFSGPLKLPNPEQRKKDVIDASDKVNMWFSAKIESKDAAFDKVKEAI